MEERDKLAVALDKLTEDQVRILTRLAEYIAEEQRADPLHDAVDVGVRTEQFKQWCASNNLDLAGVDVWVQETRRAAAVDAGQAASRSK